MAFQRGNKFGGGNPNYNKLAEYRAALLKCVKQKDIKAIMNMLVDKACRLKDVQAAKVYLEYAVGKPTDAGQITISGTNDSKQIIINVRKPDDNNGTPTQPASV